MSDTTLDAAWRDVAAFLTQRRNVSTLIEPAGSVEQGRSVVTAHGFQKMFAMVAEAVAAQDEVKLSIGTGALTYLLASSAILSGLPDTASLVPSLTAALCSGSAPVERLALGFLRDVATTRVTTAQLPREALCGPDILTPLLAQLRHGDDKISVADAAADILVAAAGGSLALPTGSVHGRGVAHTLAVHPTPELLGKVVAGLAAFAAAPDVSPDADSVLFARVMALVARVAGTSDAAFDACDAAGLVRTLLDAALDVSDPLVQIIVVDLLPSLAGSASGAAALVSSGAYAVLLQLGGVPSSAPGAVARDADPLVGGTALQAAADAAAEAAKGVGPQSAEALTLRGLLIPGLFTAVQSSCSDALADMPRAASSLSALGSVGHADPAVVAELASASQEGAVREWLELGTSSQAELRLACLSTLARILHGGAGGGEEGSVGASSQPLQLHPYTTIFDRLGPCCGRGMDSTDVLRSALSNVADPPSRFAAYDVLTAVVSLPGNWGLRRVFGAPGMTAALCDRNTESSKEGKEWKFGVLRAAVAHPSCDVLGEETLGRLRTWVSRGPFAADMAGPATVHMTV